ncbi:MAG: sigma 54-interacting transcriptional regulator, partial [Acidobacteriota bacterium]
MITSLPPEDDGLARFFGKLLQAQHRKERVLDVLVEGAIELLNAESGYLVRELKGNLFFYRRWGERPDGNKKAVSRAIVRYALGRGEPVLVPDVGESEFAMRESVEAQSLRSVLASRIDAEEEVALYIESGSRAMGPEDLGLFRTIVEMTNPILVEDARRLMNGNGADVERNYDLGDFVAEDPKTLSLLDLAAKVAATEHPVLVTGPNGSGKERVADFVHRNSSRAKQALHPMNCTTLTESLAESLLFGQEAGAFTGAKEAKGAFGEADGSTLLLDEIGELKPDLQVKLLRVLESQEVQPLGARRPKKVNVRVLAATNRDLELAVRQGVFREDLFHRLNVFRIEVPPLAERPGDVMPLFRHFLSDLCVDDPLPRFTREARDALEAHRWSGNVREVRNLAIRLAT